MANESLVMTASVRDDFSSTLRKLQNDLKSLSNTGAASTKTLRQDWKGVGTEINSAAGTITRDMLPAMRQGNLAGLALGGAIGAAAVALKNFAENTSSMANFSKEIGISTRELSKLQALGKFFGLDPATVQGNLRTFQDFMNRLKNDSGRAIAELRTTFGVAGDELAGKLLNAKSMKEAAEIAFEAIRSTGNESKARAIAQAVFGNESWANIIRNATPAVLAQIERIQSKIDENKEAAEKFKLAMLAFTTSLENLYQKAMTPLLEVTSNLMEKFGDQAIVGFAKSIETVDKFARSLAEAFKEVAGWIAKIEEFTSSSGIGAIVGMLPKPGVGGAAAGAVPTMPGTVEHLNRFLGTPGGAPGSPAKGLEKSNEDLKRSTDELKRSNEKQTTLWEKFVAALGQGGDTAGLGPGMGGVSAGAGGLGGAGALREFMGGAGGGPSIRRGATTGGGGGRPVAGASTQTAMRAAMDQLRKEGVPEGNLRAAAAHLVGQAQMESGLNPSATHDQGTGAGIYGARDDPRPGGEQRRSKMFAWLAANGYDRNSLEGQQRYMAHEAMTNPRFGATRNVLMNANERTLAADTNTITRNFEAPAVVNNRSGAVLGAYRSLSPGESPAALKDLRVKAGATGGGEAAAGVVDLARYAQSNIQGFNRVTAMNDTFHHRLRRNSAHTRGLATDFTIDDPRQSAAAAQQIRDHLATSGLDPGDFKVIDEYKKLSRGGTGGHIHTQFRSEEAAERYRKSTLLQQQSKAEKARESKLEASGTVNVHLHDGLREKNAKVDTDGMFKDVNVSRGRPMSTAEDNPLGRASAGF